MFLLGWKRGLITILLAAWAQLVFGAAGIEPPPRQAVPIRAVFEPLPPQITADGGGLVKQVFEHLERQGLGPFEIQMMPYSRAKRQLLSGDADLAGFTPLGNLRISPC